MTCPKPNTAKCRGTVAAAGTRRRVGLAHGWTAACLGAAMAMEPAVAALGPSFLAGGYR